MQSGISGSLGIGTVLDAESGTRVTVQVSDAQIAVEQDQRITYGIDSIAPGDDRETRPGEQNGEPDTPRPHCILLARLERIAPWGRPELEGPAGAAMGNGAREAMARFPGQRTSHRVAGQARRDRSGDEACGDTLFGAGECFVKQGPNMQTIGKCGSATRVGKKEDEMGVGCRSGLVQRSENDAVGAGFPDGRPVRPDDPPGTPRRIAAPSPAAAFEDGRGLPQLPTHR